MDTKFAQYVPVRLDLQVFLGQPKRMKPTLMIMKIQIWAKFEPFIPFSTHSIHIFIKNLLSPYYFIPALSFFLSLVLAMSLTASDPVLHRMSYFLFSIIYRYSASPTSFFRKFFAGSTTFTVQATLIIELLSIAKYSPTTSGMPSTISTFPAPLPWSILVQPPLVSWKDLVLKVTFNWDL